MLDQESQEDMKKKGSRKAAAYANPVTQAILNARPLLPELVQDMRLREWSALESFATGRATGVDARLLLELHCMCSTSIAMGIGIEAKDVCDRATDVLTAIFEAYPAGESMRMDAAQLAVVREMHDLHDQQRALCTRREYIEMLGKADAMIQAGSHPGQQLSGSGRDPD